MKKYLLIPLLLALLLSCAGAEPSEVPEALLHEALLSTMPLSYYPACELVTESHTILGTDRAEDALYVYVAASVGAYGFLNDVFVCQSGWGGPCTVVLEEKDGAWALREVLEIEDYGEMPSIMPQWAIDRFFAGTEEHDNDEAAEQNRQAQAYLNEIGRTERVAHHTNELDLDYAHIILKAYELYSLVDSGYPFYVSTSEHLENGERILYTRSWRPDDPDAEQSTGVETLQKRHRTTGEIFETTVVDVAEDLVTITFRDEYGSKRYEFRWNGEGYDRPLVSTQGDCRMDTERLDAYIEELPQT